MGRTIKLTDAQWDELDHVRMGTGSADLFRNCTIILMSAVDRSQASISNDLGCCTDTVARVRRLYREGGVKALVPIKPPGRPGRATPAFIAQMKQAVQTNPLTLGYGFSTWSAARLAQHLAQVYPQGQTRRTGIRKSQKRPDPLEKKR